MPCPPLRYVTIAIQSVVVGDGVIPPSPTEPPPAQLQQVLLAIQLQGAKTAKQLDCLES